MVRGVILDIDGTLVDSNVAHARSWAATLREEGFDISTEQVLPLIGMGGDKLLPRLTGIEKESARGKRISDRRSERFEREEVPGLKPFPQARAMVQRMIDEGLKVVVGTSANKKELKTLLEVAGIQDLIEGATSSDDAEESKPDPDIIQAALKKLELPPGEVVMLGDTPYDIEAAGLAGVRTIALRCGGWNDKGLADALAIFQDPAELLAKYHASPLGRRAAQGLR